MTTPQRGRGGRRGRGRRGRGGFTGLRISRHEMIHQSDGVVVGAGVITIPIVPDTFPGLLPIARQYTEYRFVRFQMRFVPGTGTQQQGFIHSGFFFTTPAQIDATTNSLSTTAGYRVGSLHEGPIVSRLPRGAEQQRFYQVFQQNMTAEEINDMNNTQAFAFVGYFNVQSLIYTVMCSYTVLLRGPVHNVNGGIPEYQHSAATSVLIGGRIQSIPDSDEEPLN